MFEDLTILHVIGYFALLIFSLTIISIVYTKYQKKNHKHCHKKKHKHPFRYLKHLEKKHLKKHHNSCKYKLFETNEYNINYGKNRHNMDKFNHRHKKGCKKKKNCKKKCNFKDYSNYSIDQVDRYGCITTQGESWCQKKNRCIKINYEDC